MTASKCTPTGKVDHESAQVSVDRLQRSECVVIVKMKQESSESTHADTQAAIRKQHVGSDWTEGYRGGTAALPAPLQEAHPP